MLSVSQHGPHMSYTCKPMGVLLVLYRLVEVFVTVASSLRLILIPGSKELKEETVMEPLLEVENSSNW